MKKNHEFGHYANNAWTKTVRVMKLTTILIFLAMFSVAAEGFSQGGSISLKMEDASLKEVFQVLKANSDYTFVYSEDMVSKIKVDQIDVENASFDRVLNLSLEGTDLEYFVEGDVVVIRKKAPVVEQPIQQEKKNLTGQVTDADGIALPGVSVVIKGTNTGVATDIDGNYSIEIEDSNVVLIFSFVGMLPQEVTFEGQVVQNVTLMADTEQMAEVVVTGYQTISKERATGSFTVLDSENVSNSPNETIGDNLESLVAGIQTTVDENGNTKIAIRGESSLTQESPNPLIVVDGFAIDGGFETINRNDIDKITVLKDAAAASIWGAKAANGVVVIVTKKGNAKKGIQVDIEAYTKFSDDVDLAYVNPIASSESQLKYEMMLWQQGYGQVSTGITSIGLNQTFGHDQFEEQQKAHLANGGTGWANFTLDTPALQSLMKKDYKKQVKDLMLRKASSQNYNVSLRGQGEKNRYSLSVMYNKNNKVMKEDHDDNVLINFRNIMKVREWLDFDIAVMTQIKNQKSGGVGLGSIKEMSPYETLLDEDGNYAHIIANGYDGSPRTYNTKVLNKLLTHVDGFAYDSFMNNPLQNMRSQNFKTKTLNHRINGGLNVKIADGIHVKSSFQYERGTIDTKNIYGEDSWYTRKLINSSAVTDYGQLTLGNPYTITEHQVSTGQIAYLKNTQTSSLLFRNQFSFNKTYGDHSFNYIAGTEISWNKFETKDDWLYGYNPRNYGNVVPNKYIGLTQAFSPSYSTTNIPRGGETRFLTQKNFSLYSNMAYTFKDKYTLSGSVRTDASNLVVDDPKFRYSPFWSVGASWQLTKEDFLTSYDWLDRLIFRATYGVNGNSPSQSARVPVMKFNPGSAPYTGAGVDNASLVELGNPTLGWEKVKQLNLALDFAMFGNKVFGSLEVYNKKSEDLLAKISLPSTDGTPSQFFNGAAMENKGIELNLNGNFKIGEVNWRPILNFAYNKNKVTQVNEVDILLNDIGSKKFVEGYALYPLWYYKSNGLNENGIPTVIGKNGTVYDANTNISSTGVFAPDLLWNAGSRIAPTVASLTNEFSYKGFSLLTTITGKFGHKMETDGFRYGFRGDGQNHHENLDEMINGNHEKVGEFALPEVAVPNYVSYGQTSYYLQSRIEDASFIRFKEVMLSYRMPKSIVSKMGCSGLKLYAHVSNVGLLWTANDKDIDPDYPKNGYFFKPERTYTLGLNLKF
ncbi:MAG: SusC/RagA family TonB-linked outer membrane protein [Labilibaculum sp.]|nr:SusC/RagA family TonB-linked outer membrane protein [Labilibaculum sp.]MBI9057203.1 SusC/RagA family TonB-linked outer membrane protein [Labilibaculum sp.]